MSAHARLSPSNKTWPHCPGSVREQAAYPDIAGDAAIDGTGSHLLLELCLTNNVPASSFDGEIIGINHEERPGGWMVNRERCERVQQCLDYVARRKKELTDLYPGSKVTVEAESRSDPGGMVGRDDWQGTCDITITVLNNHHKCLFLETVDYKDGRGWVDVKGNTQLLSYLYGKMRPFIASGPDLVRPFYPERVGMTRQTIVQPKTNPTVRYVDDTGVDAFRDFEWLSDAARETDYPDAPLVPDSKDGKGYCLWCKHKKNCTAMQNKQLTKVNDMTQGLALNTEGGLFDFVGSSIEQIDAMNNEQLTRLYDAEPAVMQVFQHIRDVLNKRVLAEGVNGFEMKPGRGSRVWAFPEAEIVKKLKAKRLTKEEIYPTKLVSPAAALKLEKLTDTQRKKLEEELIVFKMGANVLTRVAFEAIGHDPAALFAGAGETPEPAELSFMEISESELSFF